MSMERGVAAADTVLFGADPHRGPAERVPVTWRFGVLAAPGEESRLPTHCHTECLVETEPGAVLYVRARFARGRAHASDHGSGSDARAAPHYEGALWEVDAVVPLDGPAGGREVPFSAPVATASGRAARDAGERVEGLVTVASTPLDRLRGVVRVGVRVANRTPSRAVGRAPGSRVSMYAVHVVLKVDRGAFVSLLQPPAWAGEAVASCRNEHTWPVLLGLPVERALMLSSPVALPDHPDVVSEEASRVTSAVSGAVGVPPTRALTVGDTALDHASPPSPVAGARGGADGIAPETLDWLRDSLRHRDGATAWAVAPYVEAGDIAGPGGPRRGAWWNAASGGAGSRGDDAARATGGVAVRGGFAVPGSRVRVRSNADPAAARDTAPHDMVGTVTDVYVDPDGACSLVVALDSAADHGAWHCRTLLLGPGDVSLRD